MKKSILILLLLGILVSCNKNDDDTNTGQIITENITISNSEIFIYNLGPFGDEQGSFIYKQAKNYEISEISNINLDEKVYRYKAKNGFIGTDYLEIKRTEFNIGTGKITEINTIKITLTIKG